MKSKKYPRADLARKSGLFMKIGLIIMLFIGWRAMEWKTYEKDVVIPEIEFEDDLEDDVPITTTGESEVTFVRAPHPRLEHETERVFNLLPKMEPGKQRTKPVNVSYSMPVVFDVK